MNKADTHKNTLLQFAQDNATTKNCNREFLSPTREKLKNKKFPSLQKNKTSLQHSPRQTTIRAIYNLTPTGRSTTDRSRAACNSGFAKKRVQWLIEHSTSHQLLCSEIRFFAKPQTVMGKFKPQYNGGCRKSTKE